jgi:hypothetical protein
MTQRVESSLLWNEHAAHSHFTALSSANGLPPPHMAHAGSHGFVCTRRMCGSVSDMCDHAHTGQVRRRMHAGACTQTLKQARVRRHAYAGTCMQAQAR